MKTEPVYTLYIRAVCMCCVCLSSGINSRNTSSISYHGSCLSLDWLKLGPGETRSVNAGAIVSDEAEISPLACAAGSINAL